jgi:hypothetical protein
MSSAEWQRTPIRHLFLLRHAKSSWENPQLADHDRPLAPRGRRATNLIAEHLSRELIAPALVLCSSARRARETLERGLALQEPVQTARRLGHEPIGWLRSDEEYVSVCGRCGARIYTRLGARLVEDGEALTERCRNEAA